MAELVSQFDRFPGLHFGLSVEQSLQGSVFGVVAALDVHAPRRKGAHEFLPPLLEFGMLLLKVVYCRVAVPAGLCPPAPRIPKPKFQIISGCLHCLQLPGQSVPVLEFPLVVVGSLRGQQLGDPPLLVGYSLGELKK